MIRNAVTCAREAYARLDWVPYRVLALPLRLAIATVFWNSGMAKLANWDSTLFLFSDEYQLPLLPPALAATMAATTELSAPPLLLLGMTFVIEVFVYPLAWPTHIQWAAMLPVLICHGGGAVSVDRLLGRWWFDRAATAQV
jgi:putative oxidoreductase